MSNPRPRIRKPCTKITRKLADEVARKAAFLTAFPAMRGQVVATSRQIGVSHSLPYKWLANDQEFADKFDAIKKELAETIEAELLRRGVDGVAKPVYYKGTICGHVQEYSDVLLLAAAKAFMPDKYRERSDVNVTGPPIKLYVGFDPDKDL